MWLPVEHLTGARRVAFGAMIAGAVGIACAYGSAFASATAGAGPWLMALSLPVCLVAVMTLGAVRPGRGLGALLFPFSLVFILVCGGFFVALFLPTESIASRLVFGLPVRATVIIYGVGILPLFVLPIAYALTFDQVTLTDDDVAKIRAMADANAQRVNASVDRRV